MPVPVDGPKIVFVPPNIVFGSENVGDEIPNSPFMTYAGGTAAQAMGQSSFIGQIVDERDIQPFNACSNSVGPPPTPTTTPVNLAY
jgi:hypothetical protein